MYDAFRNQLPDSDADETQEWLEALDQVIDDNSPARARYLMNRLLFHAGHRRIGLPAQVSTDYINTISPEEEPFFPGNEAIEHRIRRMIRWNAATMVSRANKAHDGIGGHLSTYASAASSSAELPSTSRVTPTSSRSSASWPATTSEVCPSCAAAS